MQGKYLGLILLGFLLATHHRMMQFLFNEKEEPEIIRGNPISL
jgi:hypothetical protein